MNRYLFTVRLIGDGNNPDEAWLDAVSARITEEPFFLPTDENDYTIIAVNDDE